jgi:minor extracellular serine protease Vpr
VFSCNPEIDGTRTDLLLQAIEQAYADKMDIVNMSLGSGSDWPNSLESDIVSILAEKGIVVVAAQGNFHLN